ncbi:PmoA family protein [Arthrobacter agilis]|uniref:DUF6807 family protein n=1 Tax=Arthrobacter agilis TaxID=37921 RepID=UPI0023667CA5|nr:DUF6807 family protein [Arthrobacter agilis]WDF32582.1 PmoA family protein [Arthrobacter agilis]
MTGSVPLMQGSRPFGLLCDGADLPADHSPRPFVHPVLTPDGSVVSDDRPSDHAWHHGLGIAVSSITVAGRPHPVNLWGGPTYCRGEGYVQLDNNGVQFVGSVRAGDGRVAQQLAWRAPDGAAILTEERSWSMDSVQAGGVGWNRTTVRSRWRNSSGADLAFGSPTTAGRPDAGYGGFFLRLAPDFDGADVITAVDHPETGAARTPGAVEVGEADARGSRGDWLGVRSADASVLMVSAPANPGGTTPWFVRVSDTPMLCAAPFFHRELRLGPAGQWDWTWSLLTADGAAQPVAFAGAAAVPLPAFPDAEASGL